MNDEKRTRVALIACDSYETRHLRCAVERAINLLGGIQHLGLNTGRVLIKPNLLSPQPPARHVTTHPSVIKALIQVLRKSGVSLTVGDSPGFHPLSRVAEESGVSRVLNETGVALASFEEGVMLPSAEGSLLSRIPVARAAAEADAIISVPKFKTHCLTHITCAIKNCFGCVPGLKKAEMHYRFPDMERFSRMLVDICRALSPCLHIVDAITAMEGNGPSRGTPFRMGVLIAGTDPVAVDTITCMIAGIDPGQIPMIQTGARTGLGIAAPERIELLGATLTEVRVSGFSPATVRSEVGRLLPLPRALSKRFQRWFVLTPRIRRRACTRCLACVGICPARPRAITRRGPKLHINPQHCIRCYCCSEICPSGAIELRRGFAARLLAKLLKIQNG